MSRTTGARLFAEIVQGYGLTHVFYVPQVISKALVAMAVTDRQRFISKSAKTVV